MERVAEKSERDALIERYQSYVHHIAGGLIQKLGLPQTLFDEFAAAGYLGLVEAAERYDATCGSPFKCYAYLRIRGAIIDSVRECHDLSGEVYQYAKALKAAHSEREGWDLEGGILQGAEAGSEENDPQIGRILDYLARGGLAFRLSYEEAAEEVEGVEDESENTETQMVRTASETQLRELIKGLPDKERLVIEEYYFHDRTFHEIGEIEEGLSKGWVSKLHTRALQILRRRIMESETTEGGDS